MSLILLAVSTYESEFKDGHAHSKKHLGLVVYPHGDTFEGQWRKGRFTSANITFGDDLKFEPQDWNYCVPPDRRYTDYLISHSNESQYVKFKIHHFEYKMEIKIGFYVLFIVWFLDIFRFYIERDVGVKEAGRVLYSDRLPNPYLPPGMYDTGDGIYDPQTATVTGYNGQKLR